MSAALPSILFVHDQYPGQFGPLAQHLHDAGWTVSFATLHANLPRRAPYRLLGYAPHRAPSAQTHPYAQSYDRAVLTGQACARACATAADDGELVADIVVSHTGPGAGLFLRDVFPEALIVAYCEWWYRAPGIDTGYLAVLEGRTEAPSLDDLILARSRNASIGVELLSADRGLCPTQFQADQFPPALRGKLTVSHDGVDSEYYRPLVTGEVPAIPDHAKLAQIPPDAPVITYATRGMEPHRGFPQVFRAFAEFAAERDDAYFVMAGENKVFYGSDADRRIDWLARLKAQYPMSADRLICPGMLSKSDYRWLLRRSSAHLYCTVPFVLSWSLLQAMSAGVPLIVSDVEPVREVMPGTGAFFADMASEHGLTEALRAAISDTENSAHKALITRSRILRDYDLKDMLSQRRRWLLEGLRNKRDTLRPSAPSPTAEATTVKGLLCPGHGVPDRTH